MQKTINLSVPHRLGREEARRRLQSGLTQIHQQLASHKAHVAETWSGDHMDFRVDALGQNIAGRLDVRDDAIDVQVDLPWVLALLADKIKGRVQQEGRKLLEKK